MQQSGLEPYKSIAYFEYDFAVHGGAVGDIAVPGTPVPPGAIITSGVIQVKQAVTSEGAATVAAKALSDEDILAATAKSALTANALLDVVPNGAAANMIRLTAHLTTLTLTVAEAALTAGKILIALEYLVAD